MIRDDQQGALAAGGSEVILRVKRESEGRGGQAQAQGSTKAIDQEIERFLKAKAEGFKEARPAR